MKVKDIMDKNIVTVPCHASLKQAANTFYDNKIADLIVIDDNGRFIGVLSQGDLIRKVLPDLDELKFVSNGMLAKAYKIFLESGAAISNESIENLIIRKAITLEPDDELLKGAIVMTELQIQSIPVLKDGKLVGVISRNQICRAILS